MKPKSNKHPVNGDLEKGTPSDYSKHISGEIDHLDEKNVHRPISVRSSSAKPPVPDDAYGEVPNSRKKALKQAENGSKFVHDPSRKMTSDLSVIDGLALDGGFSTYVLDGISSTSWRVAGRHPLR